MDGHGQARTNTDRLEREYGISQDPVPACFVFSLETGARIKDTRSVGELETRQGHESL